MWLGWTMTLALAVEGGDAYYTMAQVDAETVDISAVGTAVGSAQDDATRAVALPFAFPYYGGSYTTVGVSSNGGVRLGDSEAVTFVPRPMWDVGEDGAQIACWWDDLIETQSTLWWHDADNDRVIIAWRDAADYDYGGSLSFEMMLYEDGTIECHYADTGVGNAGANQGHDASIGIREDAAAASPRNWVSAGFGGNEAWLQDGVGLRFSPCADADGDGFACGDCDDAVVHAGDADSDGVPDDCDVCADDGADVVGVSDTTTCEPGHGEVTVFDGAGWTGTCATFSLGYWTLPELNGAGIANDAIRSVKVGAGATVTLYQHYSAADGAGYGTELTLTEDLSDLSTTSLGLSASAMWVGYDPEASLLLRSSGCFEADARCVDADGDGRCADEDDCDDADASVYVDAPESTDACGDNDCDGVLAGPDVDEDLVCDDLDATWDGWTSATVEGSTSDGPGVALADADADGDLDLFATLNTRRLMGVYLNDGHGSFGSLRSRSVNGSKTFSVAAGDLDGDGDDDAVITGESDPVFAWVGMAGGAPSSTTTLATVTSRLRGLRTVDLDLDGDLDVVAADYSGGAVRSFFNDGSGGFSEGASCALSRAQQLDVGDLDGDGRPDVAVSTDTSLGQACFFNGSTFDVVSLPIPSGHASALIVDDLDGDGLDDVILAGTSGVSWIGGSAARGFSVGGALSTVAAVQLTSGDLDHDGDVDVIASETTSHAIVALLGDGAGGLARAQTLATFTSSAIGLDAGDLDGDGDVDVVAIVAGDVDDLLVLDNPLYVDADGDYANDEEDCDDADASAYPGAAEVCDGIDNDCDAAIDEETTDTDADGTCDALDACPLDAAGDSDGDGSCDADDACPLDATNDSDGDGSCDSADLCVGDDTTGDVDGDGACGDSDLCLGDDAVGDRDGDGTCDDWDGCPLDAADDSDGDGLCDSEDACVGDDATGDSDDDGACDDVDACPLDASGDSDGDGACDSDDPCPLDAPDDSDGDNLCDSDDACPFDASGDSDGDGSCDSEDLCAGDDASGDSDDDGVCDDADACPLDAADDSDGDGSCDSDDLCEGDDSSGDSDADGVCDDADFALRVGAFQPGASLTLTALRAQAGARVYFLVSTAGTGSGPCYPGSTLCLDIRQPINLGSAVASAGGRATLTLTVPATVPPTARPVFQAAWIDASSGTVDGDVTPVARPPVP